MASANRRYTVQEILEYLDDGFDIPNEGLDSDLKGYEDEEDSDDLHFEPDTLDNDEDEDLDLRTVDIIDDSEDTTEASGNRGRPGNVSVEGLDWSSQGSDLEVPLFSRAVGPLRVMTEEASALDFFLLFVDNQMLNNMGNKQVCCSDFRKTKQRSF